MKSFFKNAADEIARRRIDQIEMEMTQNPAQYPEFASALRELDGTDNSTAYAQDTSALKPCKQGFNALVSSAYAVLLSVPSNSRNAEANSGYWAGFCVISISIWSMRLRAISSAAFLKNDFICFPLS